MVDVPTTKSLGREPVEVIEIVTPKCANVYGSSPCTAAAATGGECFNTRATCQDTANYQARPLAHLTPDRLLAQGDTGTTDFNGQALYIVEADIYIPPDPDGIVFECGGSGAQGLYIGFTAGDLVVRAGVSTSATPTGSARVAMDATPYEGKNYTLIGVFEYDSGVACTVTAYLFDPIELELTQIGTATSSTDPTALFDTGGYGVGTINGTVPVGESADDYNGTVSSLRMYDNQAATLSPSADAYRTRYFFDDGRKARPSDSIYILPMLTGVSTIGSRINISGSDDRYEAIGRLAFLECGIADAPHSDYPFDPYRATRLYDPLTRGTFWIKWLAREKFGRTKSLLKRYTGYDGDALADMRSQTYVLDRVARGVESVSISARDVLSLTEFRRAQVPAPTEGALDVTLLVADTTAFLAGDVTASYPASGTLRINDELMTYTARTYDAVDDQTDFTGLTRGTDGSTADEHAVEDTVQNCRRYTNASVSDILLDFLLVDAQVQGQLVDVSKILTEDLENLTAYSLSTVISEPTGVDVLIGELSESCAFYIWWNERAQKVDMQAIKPLSSVESAFSDEANVVGDSLTIEERPKERVSTLSLYYHPRDFAGDLRAPSNYRHQTIVASSNNNDVDQYAKLPQIREVFSRWIITNAQSQQTAQRYVNRYVDIPIYASHLIDAKDGALWVGDFVTLSTDQILNAQGERSVRRFVIIEAEEPEPSHLQRVVLADVTLDGRVYVITENGVGTYTSALFESGLAFITDNDGLNPDGSTGATIG